MRAAERWANTPDADSEGRTNHFAVVVVVGRLRRPWHQPHSLQRLLVDVAVVVGIP